MTDSEVQQLIVWVGTQAKIDEAKQQGTIGPDDFVVVTDAPELQEKLTSANAGTGISITEVGGVVKISNTQTSAEWGNILGTLSDQLDLKQALDLKLPTSTKYGSSLSLSIDPTTFVVTVQLKDQDGNNLGQAGTIDLPLESVVVGGQYDDATKKVILTLENGSTIDFSVADLVSGLQTELTAQNKLNADYVDDSNSANKFTTTQEKTTWNGKQDAIADLNAIRDGAAAGATALQGVQVAGTELTPDANNKVNIPKASNSTLGVIKQGNGNETGIIVSTDGIVQTYPASDTRIENKTGNAPVVPSNLNKAVMEGLGNNSLTWTDAYKSNARTTIGAISSADIPVTDVQINSTSILSDGVANIPIAANNRLGVVFPAGFGVIVTASGALAINRASDALIDAKTNNFQPVVPSNLDYAVKVGVTTNANALTDTEKTSARNWIGAQVAGNYEQSTTIQPLSATDSITLADNTIYNGGEITSLTIALPATVDVSFLCEIDFTSGITPATLAYPNTIKWLGDDVANNVFIPVASKRYTVIVAYDGVNYRATVKGVA